MRVPMSPKLTQKRIFLFRRKLDGVVFSLGAAMFLLPTNASAIIFGIFLVMGIYLMVVRPAKSLRHLDKKYVLAALFFSTACLYLLTPRHSFPRFDDWVRRIDSVDVYGLASDQLM
jgi:hypothetical protein